MSPFGGIRREPRADAGGMAGGRRASCGLEGSRSGAREVSSDATLPSAKRGCADTDLLNDVQLQCPVVAAATVTVFLMEAEGSSVRFTRSYCVHGARG